MITNPNYIPPVMADLMPKPRLKPDQIKPGRSYRLMPRYSYIPGLNLIRRVEAIQDGEVIVHVNGKEVRMPVRDFAALAVEEVCSN